MPVGVGSICGAWMSGSIEDSICVVRFLDPLSFGIRACCDLVVLIGHECVDAMSFELSCRCRVQMRFQ